MKIYVAYKSVANPIDAKTSDNEDVFMFTDINLYVGLNEEKAKNFNIDQFDKDIEDIQYLAIEVWENEVLIEELIQESSGIWEVEEKHDSEPWNPFD